jgi:hypothetical protein
MQRRTAASRAFFVDRDNRHKGIEAMDLRGALDPNAHAGGDWIEALCALLAASFFTPGVPRCPSPERGGIPRPFA